MIAIDSFIGYSLYHTGSKRTKSDCAKKTKRSEERSCLRKLKNRTSRFIWVFSSNLEVLEVLRKLNDTFLMQNMRLHFAQ